MKRKLKEMEDIEELPEKEATTKKVKSDGKFLRKNLKISSYVEDFNRSRR